MTAKEDGRMVTTNNNNNNAVKDGNKYTEEFFQKWLDDNTAKLKPLLPTLDASKLQFFTAACQHVQDCAATLADAVKKREEIQKHKPVDQDALDKANKAVDDATDALSAAKDDSYTQSLPLLDELESKSLDDTTFQLLLVTNVLIEGTPKGLAKYCEHTSDYNAKALVALLQDKDRLDFLQSMVMAGGAKAGKYGQALEIWTSLQRYVVKDDNHALWQRLALAVALELADPLLEFHQQVTYVDPIQRFLHYQQAYRFGELDPVFATEFGVWELRMVINSVAPTTQLAWGRQMLRNYRPDLMELNDKWRYCRIVRTDVFYTGHPNWDPNVPLDFPQILSGGGECGPRAWMGRFICRAFGIPVWGVREPGHAAMARWTKDGWVVCLGAPMKYAWWDIEGGLHFQAEAAARKALQPDDKSAPESAFGKKVLVLQWIANLLQEPTTQVVRNCLADPNAPWRTLSLMQMNRLAPPPQQTNHAVEQPIIPRLVNLKLRNQCMSERITTLKSDGTIIIPATTCSDPTKPNANVLFMDSFLGGQQLFLNKDGHVEYTLVEPAGGKYELVCHIVTVHDDKVKLPLLVTIEGSMEEEWGEDGIVIAKNDDDNVCSVYSIPLQYTTGMWEETKPVTVELPTGVKTCKIGLSRESTAHGLAIKDLKLVPVTSSSNTCCINDGIPPKLVVKTVKCD